MESYKCKDIYMGIKKSISFGAGVNSIAMTIMLFNRGEIYPVIFADTMAEHPETYCYMDYFEEEFMAKFGQKIIRISPITHPDLYPPSMRKPLIQYCYDRQVVPFVTIGKFCSTGFKVKPIEKLLKRDYTDETGMVAKLIAFSYEEKNRIPNVDSNIVVRKQYPLVDEGIGRRQCFELIKEAGLSQPRKSRCYFCPYQDKTAWKRLWEEYPDLFKKSKKMEIRATNKNGIKTTLLPSGVSLEDLEYGYVNQIDAFPDWDFEELEPCMCKL